MKKFKFGPLVWNCVNEDDESGNYFWNGNPPVDYDDMGIPVDQEGLQCLPADCPIHPSWQANYETKEYNEFLGFEIPTIESTKEWFDENFLIVSDKQIKKYIIRWIRDYKSGSVGYVKLNKDADSLDIIMDRIWPQDAHK